MTESNSTVYVVDDDPGVCASLKRLMEEVSLHCEGFGTAKQFLAACAPPRSRLPRARRTHAGDERHRASQTTRHRGGHDPGHHHLGPRGHTDGG